MDRDLLLGSIYMIILLTLVGGVFYGIGNYARKKGRSFWGWILASFIISPALAFVILLCLTDLNEEKRKQEEMLLELRRQKSQLEEEALLQTGVRPKFCSQCGVPVVDEKSKFCGQCGSRL